MAKMASDRWSYQVVEARPSFPAATREAAQERRQQFGLQLVSAIRAQRFASVQRDLKKPMP
jgi:hypothetical protein